MDWEHFGVKYLHNTRFLLGVDRTQRIDLGS